MEDILKSTVDYGRNLGARYLDLRFEKINDSSVTAEDGKVKEATSSSSLGVGIRALVKGGWGFSASVLPEKDMKKKIFEIVKHAVKLAKANTSKKIELASVKAVEDKVKDKYKKNPEEIPIDIKALLCKEASQIMKEQKGIEKAVAGIASENELKIFCSSEGSYIEQERVFCIGVLDAIAKYNGITEFYHKIDGGYAGFEKLEEFDIVSTALEIARIAINLSKAKPCPTKKVPVILDPEFVALLTHEILGHPSEADRVLGREAAWAGKTWWADKVGKKLFSEQLTVVSDATLEKGYLGSFKYDDEGVPTKRVVHVLNGKLMGFLHSRETAKIFNVEPSGAMRASGYAFLPLIRMTNTFIEKGEWKFEEMLEGIKYGIYLKGNKVPSIDSRRFNFQISAFEAYEIKNGEIDKLLRGASLQGNTKDFLSSIDAVGDDLRIFPIPNCGKGDPMQTMRVGNGGPHIRGYGLVTGPK